MAVAIMLADFGVSLIFTPNDLQWQLNTALDYLYLQIWPMVILLVICSLTSPKEYLEMETPDTRCRKKRDLGK